MKATIQTASFLLTTAICSAQVFTDDFNRPDSPSVGNGWVDCISNAGPNLLVKDNRLSTTFSSLDDRAAGIYRPFPFSGTLTVSATISEMTGHNADPRRYHSGLAVYNDGSVGLGYGVFVVRSGSQFTNSEVILFDGSIGNIDVDGDQSGRVANRMSPFQFGPEINVVVTFFVDGRVTGRITGDGLPFDFSFGPRFVRSVGTNFTVFQVYPSPLNSPNPIYPTIDDVTICAIPHLHIERADSQVVVGWPAVGTNCDLYATATLLPTSWSLVREQPSLLGEFLTVTLDATNAERYFRLQKR
jgi:hypothetical protein